MTAEAVLKYDCEKPITAAAAMVSGQMFQLADGRAAWVNGLKSAASGDAVDPATEGIVEIPKTASIVILDGGKVYWDYSANAGHFKPVNDRDFYVGTAVGDASSSATTMLVHINKKPVYLIDSAVDEFTTALVLTAGTPAIYQVGGSHHMSFSATAEAQKVDMLSDRGFALSANAIVEFKVRAIDDGDAAAIDFNIGVANATHASDADSITESFFIHLDGNSTQVNAESDDGTTEVASTDTTVDYTLGTAIEGWLDLRVPADPQLYIDGVNRLSSTTFDISAATGPLKLLAHMEKSSDDTTALYVVDFLRARIQE
jgi:predicted RecA/RadA family phage recombinase